MHYLLRIALIFSLVFSSSVSAASDADMLSSVLKIKTYARDSIGGNYLFTHYGSAVLIEGNRILTNAHVILDLAGKDPTGYYEVCYSTPMRKDPICSSDAKLLSYDTVADLALLEITHPISTGKKVEYSKKDMSIGSSVIVYGYPSIGWDTITRTEGKIGGSDDRSYKFDGTIDHGNSGGGAFDTDGRLVGIPYAVSSDNGVIGYIIPMKTAREFLAKKSANRELFTMKIETDFQKYIANNQVIYKNPNLIKTKKVEIRNLGKLWLKPSFSTSSVDEEIFDYRFIDKTNRVAFMVSCGNDASLKYSTSDIYQKSITLSKNDTSYTLSGSFLDNEKNIYSLKILGTKAKNGESLYMLSIWFRNAPNCGASIIANDGERKDKKMVEKLITLVKTIRFQNPDALEKQFQSKYFTVNSLPENVYISEWTTTFDQSITPNVYFIFNSESIADTKLEILDFDSVDDYMNYGYNDSMLYRGKDYSFSSFFDRYKTLGDTQVIDKKITMKNGKVAIMSVTDLSNKKSSPIIEKMNITLFYPFKTGDGAYKWYRFSFDILSSSPEYMRQVSEFFESVEFPGTSPFSK